MRHGAHHEAQTLTITGVPSCPTRIPSNSCWVTAGNWPSAGNGSGGPDASNVTVEGSRRAAIPTTTARASTTIGVTHRRNGERDDGEVRSSGG